MCLDEWVAAFPENITISGPTKFEVGANAFLVFILLIKVQNFIFDRNSLLWPATTGLDGWVAGFLENMTISALP